MIYQSAKQNHRKCLLGKKYWWNYLTMWLILCVISWDFAHRGAHIEYVCSIGCLGSIKKSLAQLDCPGKIRYLSVNGASLQKHQYILNREYIVETGSRNACTILFTILLSVQIPHSLKVLCGLFLDTFCYMIFIREMILVMCLIVSPHAICVSPKVAAELFCVPPSLHSEPLHGG